VNAARRALFLSGQHGKGHDTLAEACAEALEPYGVTSEIVQVEALMGGFGGIGDRVFQALLSVDAIYDGFHFSQLRGDGVLGRYGDRAAGKAMWGRLRDVAQRTRPDVVISVFATGAGPAVRLKRELLPELVTAVFITDSFAHTMWVHEGTDMFLVTSQLAAASVRRYWPQAPVTVVNAPVRRSFYDAPSRREARAALGIPADGQCVLVMSGSWGVGPIAEITSALAGAGYWVLSVAGTNESLERRLRAVAADVPRVVAFGYTDRVPELMAACDVVVTSSGDTCREARLLGRGLVLLDVLPGHGRENLMHEVELGDAAVSAPTPESVLGTVEVFLAERKPPRFDGPPVSPTAFNEEFCNALRAAGVILKNE
jgi:UDP-N-acetylglucosamine:LPS N-acetylglucosamine transferase